MKPIKKSGKISDCAGLWSDLSKEDVEKIEESLKETRKVDNSRIMEFAGIWKDMPKKDIKEMKKIVGELRKPSKRAKKLLNS